jgi:hypothetical protein
MGKLSSELFEIAKEIKEKDPSNEFSRLYAYLGLISNKIEFVEQSIVKIKKNLKIKD